MTLNQIKQKLTTFFNSHAQVNDLRFQDDFDFNAERNLLYPVVNVEWLGAAINNKMTNHNLKVTIGDLLNINDPEQLHDIYSDSLLIAEDLFSFLQYEEGWTFSKSSTIQKFDDASGDRVAGVVFTITISVVRTQNTCATPTKITD